jgi:lipoate-protein ligase A
MKWRFIDLDLVDPHLGPAVFEAVMETRQKNLAADTVLFWRPNKPAVYVGYHQYVLEDINVEACRKDNLPIVRRTLGGGTGYCDQNQIIYNLIFSPSERGIPQSPKEIYHYALKGLIDALHNIGISDAVIDETRYSVYANGKKISGSGQLSTNGITDSSGSFLVDFDYEKMSKYLTNPVKNLKPGIKNPADGLTSLNRELNRKVSIEEAKTELRKGFDKALGKSTDCFLTEYELSKAEDLKPRYFTEEWTFRADERRKRRKQK